jgi:hypothetical protein
MWLYHFEMVIHCVGIPHSVIVVGMWRYHFELYLLMSFVLSLHLPHCNGYLIFLSSQYPFFVGCLRNTILRLLVSLLYHTYAHVIITVLQSHIWCNRVYNINKYMVSWMYSCTGQVGFCICFAVFKGFRFLCLTTMPLLLF